MSLLLSSSNPYEFVAYYNFGANQNAIRYDMSNLSLNLWNYEPIWGAVIHSTTEATPPPALYLYESFYWQAPAHGPVQWTTASRECRPYEPTPTTVPEPSAQILMLLGFLPIALALLIRALRKQSNRGLAGK